MGQKRRGHGVRRGVPGAKMRPATPEHAGGIACVSRLVKGGPGGTRANGANRANQANPPPSHLAPARRVTFQVTYGMGWGGNRANRRVGGGDPGFREWGGASRTCDGPRLAMVAGAAYL